MRLKDEHIAQIKSVAEFMISQKKEKAHIYVEEIGLCNTIEDLREENEMIKTGHVLTLQAIEDAGRQIVELEAELAKVRQEAEKLIETYDEYIKLITEENQGLIGLAYVHGMGDNKEGYEQGERLRAEISDLKAQICPKYRKEEGE